MKGLVIILFAVALILVAGCRHVLRRWGSSGLLPVAELPVARRPQPTGPPLAGELLASPRRLLRTARGAHVVRVLFSDGQTVRPGDPLLKLAVGPAAHCVPAYATAPAPGDITGLGISAGPYLAAGRPYAALTLRGPVRVRVAAAAAAQLAAGDSLRILSGPPGLVGLTTALTAVLPADAAASPATAVLVLGDLRWPPGTAVPVVLARCRTPAPGVLAID